MPGDHFYCTNFYGEAAPRLGYEREGITGYVYETQQVNNVPIYRWLNKSNGDHFYTRDSKGEQGPPAYHFERIEWYMYANPKAGTVALYRWFCPGNGDHFYTTDHTGELASNSGYKFEEILGYLYPTASQPGVTALHRWYSSGLMKHFTLSDNISEDRKNKLLERHTWAHYRAGVTEHLSFEEKSSVRKLYNETIHHDVINDPKVNGRAQRGGRKIWINFANLENSENEYAQTVLHEMMHCAGYSHPKDKTGTPGDNGPYFGTAPLRAELAIAGFQSDEADMAVEQAGTACEMVDEELDKSLPVAPEADSTGDQSRDEMK